VTNYPWSVVQPAASGAATGIATARELGTAFMREYLLPFEIASVLLLVALIGAIVIAFEERSGRRRVLTLAEDLALRKHQGLPLRPAATPPTPDAPQSGSAPSQP